MNARLVRLAGAAASFAVFTVAVWALERALHTYHYRDIQAALTHIPTLTLLAAGALSAAAYLIMSGYDALALHFIGRPLPLHRSAKVSFLAYGIGNSTGFANLGTASIRYRLYSAWGFSGGEIAQIIAFTASTFWIGFLALGAMVLLAIPASLTAQLPQVIPKPELFGAGFLAAYLFVILAAMRLHGRPLRIRQFTVPIPSPRMIPAMTLLSGADWILAGSALYVLLLPADLQMSWWSFMVVFLLVQVVAMISHVPAGLGILESMMVLLLTPNGPSSVQVLGAVLAYRVVYYLGPFGVAFILLFYRELREWVGDRFRQAVNRPEC